MHRDRKSCTGVPIVPPPLSPVALNIDVSINTNVSGTRHYQRLNIAPRDYAFLGHSAGVGVSGRRPLESADPGAVRRVRGNGGYTSKLYCFRKVWGAGG